MVKNGIDTREAADLQRKPLVGKDTVSDIIGRARDGGADDLTLQEISSGIVPGVRTAIEYAIYED